jgi:hypothetical protein
MDYKYIEQLMERYWNAETSIEEESILRTFFSQKDIPAEMEHLRALFADEASGAKLGDDFDARMLSMINDEEAGNSQQAPQPVKAREIKLTRRLMPLFKAAAVVAIFLTLGGALQAPWDSTWNAPEDYAAIQQQVDTVAAVQPIQAENITDMADSVNVGSVVLPKD